RAILSTPSVNRQKFAQVEAFLEQHSEKRADPQGSEAFPWYEKLAIAVLLSFSLIWVALRLSSWFSQEKEPVQREDRARGVDLTRVLRRQVAADPEAKADRPDSTVRRRRKKNTGNDESLPINRPDLAPQTRKNRQRDNTAGSEQKQVQKTDHEIKQELARITVQWEKEKTKVVGLLKEIKEKVRTGTKSDKNKADEFEKSFKNILTDWKPKSNESIQPLIKRRSSKVLPSLERFSNELKSFLNPPVVVPAVLSDSQSRASEASEHEASDVDHRPADSEGSSGSSDSESGSDSDGEADAPIIGEPLSVNTAANPNITPFSMVSSQELLHSSPQAASSSQSSTAFYAAPAAFPLYHGYLDRSDLSYRSELFGDKPDAVKVLNHYDVRFRVIKNLVDTVDSEDLACRAGRNYRTPNLRKARACLVHLSPELDSLTPKELERFSKPFNNQNGVCLFLAYQFCVRSRQLQWQNDFEGLSVDLKEYFRRYSKPEVKAFIGERARRIEAVLDLAPGIADRSQIDNALKLLCAEIGELLSARKDKDLRRVFGEPLVDKLINLRNGTFHDAREMRIVSRDNATGDVDVIVQGDDQGIDVEALCREVLDCTQCFRSDLAQVAAYP
ncbi:MAG: hypothetical protein EBX40_04415, partial [Gammaproteobacteria bacterium]|nr:hypothetical protein [Gammaproteobacteria bacterium]